MCRKTGLPQRGTWMDRMKKPLQEKLTGSVIGRGIGERRPEARHPGIGHVPC